MHGKRKECSLRTTDRKIAERQLKACKSVAGKRRTEENDLSAKALTTLLGTWVGLFLILVDVALYVSLLMKRKWAQIGVRVLASWIIAISLLVLAFALRK